MHASTLLIVLLALVALAYQGGRQRAVASAGGAARINTLHSLPSYYGFYAALWAAVPALLLMIAVVRYPGLGGHRLGEV